MIAFAGSVSASERSREAGSTDAADVSAPADVAMSYQRIDATSAMVTIGGQSTRVSVNGAVQLDEAIEAYGSIDRMQFELSQANVPSTVAVDGARMYANGATGFYADLMGTNGPRPEPRTISELKAVTPWTDQVVDGVTVITFVNGAVITDDSASFSQPEWIRHQAEVASKVDENGFRIYATGAVFQEPLYSQQESQ